MVAAMAVVTMVEGRESGEEVEERSLWVRARHYEGSVAQNLASP